MPKTEKKRIKAAAIALAFILIFVSFSSFGCAYRKKAYSRTYFEFFDTFSTITLYAESKEEFNSFDNIYITTLEEYHKLLDIYNTYDGINNLKSVNQNAGNGDIQIDPRLGEFLRFGKEIYNTTNGCTNIAMGSVLSLWHEARTNALLYPQSAAIPEASKISEAMKHIDISSLTISEDNTFASISDPKTSIDAGALGKGYTAKKISEALKDAGCESFLLDLGGNIVASGTKPDGTSWLAGIENPSNGQGFGGSVNVCNRALVTSGSYQRYFTVNGTNYHHIIDPSSGYPSAFPAPACVSVSIICSDPAMADALSTALFCLSYENGKELISTIENTEALWIFDDGSIRTTDNFNAYVTNHTEASDKHEKK